MRHWDLVRDAIDASPGANNRQMQIALAGKLNASHPADPITAKAVAKWFERGSIPGKWLFRIAALVTPPLNPSLYV